MKKTLACILTMMLIVVAAGCSNSNEERLKRLAEETEALCPIDMGLVGDLVSVSYDRSSKQVRMKYAINEDVVSMNMLVGNEELTKQSISLSLAGGENKALLQCIVDCDGSVVSEFVGDKSGERCEIELTDSDLRRILDNDMSAEDKGREYLNLQLRLMNAALPSQVDEYTLWNSVTIEGDRVVYHYIIDEDYIDMSLMQSNADELKSLLAESYDDISVKGFIEIAVSQGKGLTYRYEGSQTGLQCEMVFTADELKAFL